MLWGSRYFPEMMELTGDFGAKPLMSRHEAQLIEVEVATDSIFHDVDAPEDLARLRPAGKQARSQSPPSPFGCEPAAETTVPIA